MTKNKKNKWQQYEDLKSQIRPDEDYEKAIRRILKKLGL
jgi:hypothetical protein